MIRRPSHSAFDALVGLHPLEEIPTHAYGIVKLSYALHESGPCLRDAEALGVAPEDRPPSQAFAPANDHALFKLSTDVVVLGSAFFSRPTTHGRISVLAGGASKRIEVFGRRRASWSPRRGVIFSEPEPITRVPVVAGYAYGGWDPRVVVPPSESLAELVLEQADHPGIYPRNPQGRGYVVVGEAVEDIELPWLEDPEDLLTPERFVVEDPARWWQQPQPAFLGWCFANSFARMVHLGVDPWFPPPDDERLPEVAAGQLRRGFRHTESWQAGEVDLRFWQEAPAPFSRASLAPGDPIVVTGMHPRGETVGFSIPPPPSLKLELEGRTLRSRLHLSSVVVRPAERVATTTWIVRADRLHRKFIPQVHAEIPLALRVDGQLVPFRSPPTLAARLREAGVGVGS